MTDQYVLLISNFMVVIMKMSIFFVGYLTVRLGYNLLLAGVKGEFKFSAKIGGTKADLASVSPGLLFVLLGVLLIGYALTVDKNYYMKTSAVVPVSEAMIPEAPSPFGKSIPLPNTGSSISGKQ